MTPPPRTGQLLPGQPVRSLVIAPQWIGDAVMTEPLLALLSARGEDLTVAALPWVAPVYRAMPQVASVLELPFAHGGVQWAARRAMAATLRGQFARAYVCPNSFKSALLPWWAGIAQRVGYLGEARWGLINQRLPNPAKGQRPPMVPFYAALSGQRLPEGARPRLQLPPARVLAALAQAHLSAQSFYAVAPGAEYGPAKRWPAAYFAQVIRSLDAPTVLLGSAKDAEVCADIAAAVPAGQCINLAGRTTLDVALCLIGSARAMLSNDSGLMHVAAALDIPQVAVFGSSSPLHTPPLNPLAQVVWLKNDAQYQPPLDCAPCFERICPLGHTRCLNDIRPERVAALLPSGPASR